MTIFRRLTLSCCRWQCRSSPSAGRPPMLGRVRRMSRSGMRTLRHLIAKVRAATARFKDINVAISEGWVQGTPCVSGPDAGAMGVHFVMPSRIGNFVLQQTSRKP